MSIVRLVHIIVDMVDPLETETAEHIWKTECTPLITSQTGCISEKLLRPRNRRGFISYSEWETDTDLERFTSSAAHKEIVDRMRFLGAGAAIEVCDLVK